MRKDYSQEHRHYQQIREAISFLVSHQSAQPSLADVARHVGLSEYHLQRVFSEWAGISPKQFLQFLTKEYAKQQLDSNSVFESAIASGLSSGGRLHDLIVTWESMTPGEYKNRGKGLKIEYGIHDSPFGLCFIALTDRGICKLSFFDTEEEGRAIENELHKDWCRASVERNDQETEGLVSAIFDRDFTDKPLHMLMKGTDFQLKVWEALLSIPEGQLCSYQQVAEQLGQPSAVRAVASAVARNSIGYLIPCHRVIRGTGALNQYRWGAERKQVMIAREAAGRQLVKVKNNNGGNQSRTDQPDIPGPDFPE